MSSQVGLVGRSLLLTGLASQQSSEVHVEVAHVPVRSLLIVDPALQDEKSKPLPSILSHVGFATQLPKFTSYQAVFESKKKKKETSFMSVLKIKDITQRQKN